MFGNYCLMEDVLDVYSSLPNPHSLLVAMLLGLAFFVFAKNAVAQTALTEQQAIELLGKTTPHFKPPRCG